DVPSSRPKTRRQTEQRRKWITPSPGGNEISFGRQRFRLCTDRRYPFRARLEISDSAPHPESDSQPFTGRNQGSHMPRISNLAHVRNQESLFLILANFRFVMLQARPIQL